MTSSTVLLLLAGACCVLAALAFAQAFAGYRQRRFSAVSWLDVKRWPVLVTPLVSGTAVAALLTLVTLAPQVQLGLGALIGTGLVLLIGALALRCRVTVGTAGVEVESRHLAWSAVDDYAETKAGLTFFYREGAHRRRLDVPVPPRHRARVAQITSACLDARFEYAARVYAGHQALEG